MAIGALTAGGLSQYVLDSSNLSQTQQVWQTLQQSLATGNLSAAQTAFNSYQQLTQNLTKISGSSSASAQLTADMKSAPSQSMANATAAMAQVEGWVNDLLDSANPSSSSTSSDPTSALLQSALSPDSSSSNTDPATEALDSAYGGTSTGSMSLNVYA